MGEPGSYAQASFSPDGSRLAVIKTDVDSDTQDVWAFDVATGKGTSITSDAAPDTAPVWSPDGQQIAYVSVRANTHGVYRRAATGQGSEEMLYQHPTGAPIVLTDWSADGRFLGFWSGDTMFILPLTGERKADRARPRRFLRPRRPALSRRPLPRVQLECIRPLRDLRQPNRSCDGHSTRRSGWCAVSVRQGLGRRRHRRHRVAEGRQGIVLSVAAAAPDRHGRRLDDRTGIRGACAAAAVRDSWRRSALRRS